MYNVVSAPLRVILKIVEGNRNLNLTAHYTRGRPGTESLTA